MTRLIIIAFNVFLLMGIHPAIAQTTAETTTKEELGPSRHFSAIDYRARTTPLAPNLPQSDSYNSTPWVIGGTNANEKYWDNVVFLSFYDATTGYYYLCGGTMLTPRWVMTAAHCVTRSNGSIYPAGDIYAISEYNEPNYTDYKSAQRVYRHPSYNSVTIRNDIALIKLTDNLGGVNKTTYLWDVDTSVFDTAGNKAKTLGWGITASGNISNKLQQATTNIISNDSCSMVWYGIFDSSLCVQNPQSIPTPCNGDSGGPLFITNDANDALQVGIVSWGKTGCSIPGYPSVYARVSSFIPWIEGKVGKNNLHYASDIINFSVEDDILLLIAPLL